VTRPGGQVVELEVLADAGAVARRGAELLAARAREAVAESRRFTVALSGGRTPLAMLSSLRDQDVPWGAAGIWQVDERVAPPGHDDRNLTHIRANLPPEALAGLHPMPVEADDLATAAAQYAASLPAAFDLVHLGIGEDGHTASLVPGDPALEVTDRTVALTGEYRGRRRMTLTYPALNAAREILWIVTGADKRSPLGQLMGGDRAIPAGRVAAPRQVVVADRDAAGDL
jgi:6-phosphogluconolactonase